jgi:hypothetical protein
VSKKKYSSSVEVKVDLDRISDSNNEPGIPLIDGSISTEDTYFVSGGEGRVSGRVHITIRWVEELERYALVTGEDFVDYYETYREAVNKYISSMTVNFRNRLEEALELRDDV